MLNDNDIPSDDQEGENQILLEVMANDEVVPCKKTGRG